VVPIIRPGALPGSIVGEGERSDMAGSAGDGSEDWFRMRSASGSSGSVSLSAVGLGWGLGFDFGDGLIWEEEKVRESILDWEALGLSTSRRSISSSSSLACTCPSFRAFATLFGTIRKYQYVGTTQRKRKHLPSLTLNTCTHSSIASLARFSTLFGGSKYLVRSG
jgi:hypothetical protein